MKVDLIDHMGSDLTVVNAARVSFAKESEEMSDKDEKLIKYLAKHKHWSPFAHCFVQFRIKAPVFVARQLVKHQVGLVWNEVSRRYVDDEPEFYIPDEWRGRPTHSKQGSSNEVIDYSITSVMQYVKQSYDNLLKAGIAPEMARMILPQNMMTEWYWSGSLMAFARVCDQRLDEHAQAETSVIANWIDDYCYDLFPYSWEALRN